MINILQQMLSKHKITNKIERENAIKQVIQEAVLYGLSKAGFFEYAIFNGGTALRIFYGLDRFSEDLDFSLKTADPNFNLEKYFPMLIKTLNSLGINMTVSEREKTGEVKVKSAFVKGNTRELYLSFYSDMNIINGLHRDSLIKIKFEIDINPPRFGKTEHKTKSEPGFYQVQIFDLPSLFAGKINAVIARKWRGRTKGRDLYDFVFYVNKNIKFNLKHLEDRLKESGTIDKNTKLTLEEVKKMLYKRFDSINYQEAISDVINFTSENLSFDH